MARKAKKKTQTMSASLSPESYFRSGRPRKLDLHECLITGNWQEMGMANVLVARRHVNGHITWGFFCVDAFCLGVKDCFWQFNQLAEEYEAMKKEWEEAAWKPVSYRQVHSLIYGSIAYAQQFGFQPHKNFGLTQFVLKAVEEEHLKKIVFGKDGRPFYIATALEDPSKINRTIATLERAAGPGNYDYMYVEDPEEGWNDLEDEEDGDMEEDLESEDPENMKEGEEAMSGPAPGLFKAFFESGELEEIMSGKKMPTPQQAFVIQESILMERGYGSSEEVISQFDLADVLVEAVDDSAEMMPRGRAEEKAVGRCMNPPLPGKEDQLISKLEETITAHPHIVPLYLTRLLFGEIAERPTDPRIGERLADRFPGRPLSVLIKAYAFLQNGKVEAAFDLMGRKTRMSDAFPGLDFFYEVEVYLFAVCLCRYLTLSGKLEGARMCAWALLLANAGSDLLFLSVLARLCDEMEKQLNEMTAKEKKPESQERFADHENYPKH